MLMTTPPLTWPAAPAEVEHARMTAITALRCLPRHATTPARDVIVAETARNHWGHPHLLPLIEAQAAFLLARAIDPRISHALDGQLPRALDRFDHAPTKERRKWLDAAVRKEGPWHDNAVDLSQRGLGAVPPSWLHDRHLRDQLATSVSVSIRMTAERFGATEATLVRPGDRPLGMAVQGVGEGVCDAMGLAEKWVPFVKSQTEHAIASAAMTAYLLSNDYGPLDRPAQRIFDVMGTFEPRSVARVLTAARDGFQPDAPSATPYPAPRSKAARADARRPSTADAVSHPDSPSPNRHHR
ncbi:hypothetical protein GTY68_27475 [Streptomyces sp. SID4926]|nr:hypothetical protein [Streptomyces sp. SID4926]